MAKEAGDDDLGDVGGVGTTAGHTHHSEEQQGEETQFQNKCGRASHRERERENQRDFWTRTQRRGQNQWLSFLSGVRRRTDSHLCLY